MIEFVIIVAVFATLAPYQVTCGIPPNIEDNESKNDRSNWMLFEEEDYKCPHLIPKKMLFGRIMQGNPKKLITAPRGFGKSTNLMMMRNFFTSTPSKFEWQQRQANAKENYTVLFINLFAHESVTTYQKAYEILKEKIHLSYLEHSYLIESEKLNSREKDICERWASMRFVEMANHSITMGWTHLSRFMSKHWSPYKVFLLIDDFDSIVMSALYSANNAEFKLILSLLNGQLSRLIKDNHFVDRVVIMGESFLMGSEISAFNDIKIFRFLDDHSMVNDFGFDDTEIDRLLNDVSMKSKREEVDSWYGGYVSKNGQHLHSPFSTNKFLEERQFRSYWRQKGHLNSLLKFFQISFVSESIQRMLKYECAPVSLVAHANGDDLMKLKAFIENTPESQSHQYVHDIFFTFLFDQGYFSFHKNDSSCIVIPNIEVNQELTQTLTQYLMQKHKLNQNLLGKPLKFFDNAFSRCSIASSSSLDTDLGVGIVEDKCLKSAVDKFFEFLESVFKDYKTLQGENILNEDVLTEVIFSVVSYAPGFVTKSKLKTEYLDEDGKSKKAKIDLYMYKDSSAVIIELSHTKSKSPNSKAALQRILDRQYYKEFDNAIYTPNKIDHYLFIGLSTNNKAILSISALLDSKNATEAVTSRKFEKKLGNYNRTKKFPSRKPTLTTTPVYFNDSSSDSTS